MRKTLLFSFFSFWISLLAIQSSHSAIVLSGRQYNGVGKNSHTKMLMHFDGTSSDEFIEELEHPFTLSGDVAITELIGKFKFSGAFDANGDYIRFTDSDDWYLPCDFTIDGWLYWTSWDGTPSAGNVYTTALNQYQGSPGYHTFDFSTSASTAAAGYSHYNGSIWVSDPYPQYKLGFTLLAWHHVALVRKNNTVMFFIDGVRDPTYGTVTTSVTLPNIPGVLDIGRNTGNETYFPGNIDELRITKGLALWTKNFIPPTRAN